MLAVLRSFDVKIWRLMSRTSRVLKENRERGRENAKICYSSTKPTSSQQSNGKAQAGVVTVLCLLGIC
jgi:hypothetical protein